MVDELELRHGSIRWDGQNIVAILVDDYPEHGFEGARALRRVLKSVRAPVTALADVELTPRTRKKRGSIRLVPRSGASPFHAVMAHELIPAMFDPFWFAFDDDKELLVEYYADEIRAAIHAHGLAAVPAEKSLVDTSNLQPGFVGEDGQAELGRDHLIMDWGVNADRVKREAGRQWRIPLSAIHAIEYRAAVDTPDGLGYMQVRLAGVAADLDVHPAQDVNAVLMDTDDEHAEGFMFAAALYARVSSIPTQVDRELVDRWTRLYRTDGGDPAQRLRRLGELWDLGLLTEAEFEAKKREILDEI